MSSTDEVLAPGLGIPWREATLCGLLVKHNTELRQGATKEQVEYPPIPTCKVLAEGFQKHIQTWKEGGMRAQQLRALDTAAAKHNINKVVGVALGTMSKYAEDWRLRTALQHALLLTLREWLGQRTQEDLRCYVQDPDYTPVDQLVLGAHGVEVIEDPRAWLEMDEASILFSSCPNVPVKEIVADIARPAVVIWERVGHQDGDEGQGITT